MRSQPPRPSATPSQPSQPTGERLQKVLAAAGLGSRRHCEEYITAGRVTIDGVVADNLGVRVDPATQKVAVDGERVKLQVKKFYLLNKPKGYLCTNSDPSGRPRVIDLLPEMETRLFSVGRLDENTEGLLLVTNDGELAHRLAHPRFQVERVYRVVVAGHPTGELLEQLQKGLYFAEGKFRLRHAKKVKTQGQSTLLEVVITEGQNREVRRMFARVGHKVMSLQRIQFGPLRLANMEPGEYRPLRPQELDRLHELIAAAGIPKRRPRRETPAGDAPPRPPREQRREAPPRPSGTGRPPRGDRAPLPAEQQGRGRPFPAAGKRPASGRPAADRPSGGRPAGGRPVGGRPTGGERRPNDRRSQGEQQSGAPRKFPPKRRPKRP